MTVSLTRILTIEEFLELPYIEESPAWEYIDGVAMQKPMPKTRHLLLQMRLLTEINRHSELTPPYLSYAIHLLDVLFCLILPSSLGAKFK